MAFFNTDGMGNSLLGGGSQFGSNMFSSWFNNYLAEQRENRAREQNYKYNEMAAKEADKRQRAQYQDLYSPQAQMQQLQEAGLSPSIYASGGMAGKSGAGAIMGNGASGVNPNMYAAQPVSALEAAQIGLIKAQTNNVNENTITTEIENGIKKLNASTYKHQWQLLNSTYFGNENGVLSWSDLANSCESYEQFQSKVYEILKSTDSAELLYSKSEEGQKTLRQIYDNNKSFGNDIAVLANSEANAKLMLQITNLLNRNGFARESANAQLKQLRQVSESAELTTEQKGAMNRLIDKMGHSTTADILLVLLMMLGQYSHANLNFGVSQTNQIKK